MKNLKHLFIYLFVSTAFLSCSDDNSDDSNPSTLDASMAYEELNISYGNDSDQVFDLYLPANRTTQTKTIILVHGGGWASGDKADMDDIVDIIKTQLPSYAVANINYRLADQNTPAYPMQTNDITTVVNYLENNENMYTISNDLGFIGGSAGAHLSLLWSYVFDTENQVEMVCSIVGPTNFTDPAYLTNPVYQELISVLGTNVTTEYLEEVSPYHRVTASAPPTILFYGGQDPLIPTSQGVDMHNKLNQLNVVNEFHFYPNEGHGWIGLNWIDSVIKMKAFIETHM